MNDAVAYMHWERVVPWKILAMKAHPEIPLVPTGFGTRYHEFYDQMEPGSQIWVITRVSRERSLAGRVRVQEILDSTKIPQERWPADLFDLMKQWHYVARADPDDSAFFETNDAGPVLDALDIQFAQYRPVIYQEASLTGSFEGCMAQASRTVFISYRWKEARRFAIGLARQFRRRGLSPWLDALSIPEYQKKGDPGVNQSRLERLLQMGIDSCQLAVAVNTRSYAVEGWTQKELDHIRTSGTPWFQVMRGGGELPCEQPPIRSRKPAEVVEEILALWEGNTETVIFDC